MIIPKSTKKPRFDVDTSEKQALSSWPSMEEALSYIQVMKMHGYGYEPIIGIVRVSGTQRVMLSIASAERAGVV